MNQLFSIPVALSEIRSGVVDAAWVIPEEAEEILQSHCDHPEVTLESLFRQRLGTEPIPMGWNWMLVVLPGRYPIGGHLAWARGGMKTNMILYDCAKLAGLNSDKKRYGRTYAFPLPNIRNFTDVHVSFLWISSKGLLEEMGQRAGGWLESLSQTLRAVPGDQNWVYFADTPPEEWIKEVAVDNNRLYREWAELHHGPEWRHKDNPRDQIVCELDIRSAEHAIDETRIRYLRRYLQRRSRDARGWTMLGTLYSAMNRHSRAVVCARRAIECAPGWIFPHHLEMRCLYAMGRNTEAGRIAVEILEKAPLDACALTIAAYAASYEGKLSEAIVYMQRACHLDHFNRNSRNNLGLWYSMTGDNDCAIRIFGELLREYPDNHLYLNNAGYLFAHRGELTKAVILCERACELSRTTNNLDSLGFVYLRLGKVVEAIAMFREALELWPDHQEAIDHLAEAEALLQLLSVKSP